MRVMPAMLAMAAIVLASNVLVQFRLGDWLTWGALTYPVAFLITDTTNRILGVRAARRVVFAGFVAGILSSLIAAGLDKTTLRIAAASAVAYLAGQLLDVTVFDALRGRSQWWKAPLVSSVAGSAVDTVLFFSIAFAAGLPPDANTGWANEAAPLLGTGGMAPLWVSLALADWWCKLALALLTLAPFRLLVRNILRQPVRN